MRALVRRALGGPEALHVEEVPTPRPADTEVLVRVHAASINLGDWELLTGQPRYITVLANLFSSKPRYEVPSRSGEPRPPKIAILGTDLAGRVESVGRSVSRFRPGDEVFGECLTFGAFAEYACLSETAALARKPEDLSFEQAAALPQAGFLALQAIRDRGRVQPGQRVLVNGAGGGAGTLAVRIAKAYGAEVTGVDGPTKQDLMRSVGADHVVDYTREDYTRDGRRYHLVFDLAAYRRLSDVRRALEPDGLYLAAGGTGTILVQTLLLGPLLSPFGNGRVGFLLAKSRSEDLVDLQEFLDGGRTAPVIEEVFPLERAREAFQRIGDKLAQGKLVITL